MKPILLKAVWGVVAVCIYLLLIGSLFFYFNHRSDVDKKHYVKKNESRIQVSLASPSQPKTIKKQAHTTSKKKPSKKPKHEKHRAKKPLKHPTKSAKHLVKKQEHNRTKPSPKRARDLFANVKTQSRKKPLIMVTDKPVKHLPKRKLFEMVDAELSPSSRSALKKQKEMDSGVENSYLAKVQNMLEGWPAQSDFAGEKVKVHLKIDPTGRFEFEIKRRSRNRAFNQALTEYLEQLQEFGFGPHKGSRTYLFEAEFVAKE